MRRQAPAFARRRDPGLTRFLDDAGIQVAGLVTEDAAAVGQPFAGHLATRSAGEGTPWSPDDDADLVSGEADPLLPSVHLRGDEPDLFEETDVLADVLLVPAEAFGEGGEVGVRVAADVLEESESGRRQALDVLGREDEDSLHVEDVVQATFFDALEHPPVLGRLLGRLSAVLAQDLVTPGATCQSSLDADLQVLTPSWKDPRSKAERWA